MGRSLLLFLKFGAIDALHKTWQGSIAWEAPGPPQPRGQACFHGLRLDASPLDGSSKSHAWDSSQHQVLSQGRFDLKPVHDHGSGQAPFQAFGGARMAFAQVRQDGLQSGFSLGPILTPNPLELLGGPASFLTLQMGNHTPSHR